MFESALIVRTFDVCLLIGSLAVSQPELIMCLKLRMFTMSNL